MGIRDYADGSKQAKSKMSIERGCRITILKGNWSDKDHHENIKFRQWAIKKLRQPIKNPVTEDVVFTEYGELLM